MLESMGDDGSNKPNISERSAAREQSELLPRLSRYWTAVSEAYEDRGRETELPSVVKADKDGDSKDHGEGDGCLISLALRWK